MSEDKTMEDRLPPDPPFSALTLARLRAGDLPPGRRDAVEAALASSPALRDLAAREEAAEAAFVAEWPWERVAEDVLVRAARLPDADRDPVMAVLARGERRIGSRLSWRMALAAALAAAVAVVVALLPPGGGPLPGEDPGVRLKGRGGLSAFVLDEGEAIAIAPGTPLAAGDRIQFRLATSRSYVALLGVDGTGTVSRYLPVGGEESVPVVPGGSRPLPDSLVLDDAPGPEVFLAFCSDEALAVEDLERAVHDALDARGGAGSRGAAAVDWEGLGLAPEVAVFAVEKEERDR
ncbi:DUF4384 domain-containing protein [Myxococcota bacterium]|nr:DUF4384 domain-containing protein [Myxococcota bacterium]